MRRAIAGWSPAGGAVHRRSNVGRTARLAPARAIRPVAGTRSIRPPRTIAYTRLSRATGTITCARFYGTTGTISCARFSGAIRTRAPAGLFWPSGTITSAWAWRLRPFALLRQLGWLGLLRLGWTRRGPRRFAGADPRSRPRFVFLARARRTANAPSGWSGRFRCCTPARRAAKASAAAATHTSADTTPCFSLADTASVKDTRGLRHQRQRQQREKNYPEELLHSRRLTSLNRVSRRLVTPNHRMARQISTVLGRLPAFYRLWPSSLLTLGK